DVEYCGVTATLNSLCLPWLLRRRHEICWHGLSRIKSMKLIFRYPPQPLQVFHLCFQRVLCPVEPKPPIGSAMDSQRTPNGVAELPFIQSVVFREDLNAIG